MPQGIQNPGFSESHVPHIRTYHTASLQAVLCNFILPLSFVPDSPRSHLQLSNQCCMMSDCLILHMYTLQAARSLYEWKIKRCYMPFNIHIFIVVSRYEEWIDKVQVNIYVLFCLTMSFTAYTNEIYV